MEAALQVQVVGFQIGCRRLDQSFRFGELDSQSIDDSAADFILDCKEIFHLPLVPFRPHLISVKDTHKLRRDANAIALSTNTAFKNHGNAELTADVADVDIFAFESE